jgi:ribonucleoside-diphosphate reductase beta chain
MGDLPGLSANEVKEYIMFICNRRCEQLGLKIYYPDIKENPLPWIDTTLGLTITNFFNGTPAEYEKSASITGWNNIF